MIKGGWLIFNTMKLFKKIWAWLPAFIILVLNFILSSKNGVDSNEFSMKFTFTIYKVMSKILPDNLQVLPNLWELGILVRKIGHMLGYALFAVSILLPFSCAHVKRWKSILFSFIICIVAACFDEIHQLYISGRSGKLFDVMIDCIGFLVGIAFFYFMQFLLRRIRNVSVSPS